MADRWLAALSPKLRPGEYAFCAPVTMDRNDLARLEPLMLFREEEGITVVLDIARARALQLPIRFVARWITLEVYSDLEGVGLTAAFSRALGEAGICCNVVAAVNHDHLFVPVDRAAQAIAVLEALQASARAGDDD
jgi:hypothetical protein